ncbi:transcription factor 25 [Erpetoichthys calabaricus]|nr:transcription factor 25 [Erpetoichthys calabaricus]
MSSRALRRLKGKQRGQEPLQLQDLELDNGEEEDDEGSGVQLDAGFKGPSEKCDKKKGKMGNTQKINNLFELIQDIDNEIENNCENIAKGERNGVNSVFQDDQEKDADGETETTLDARHSNQAKQNTKSNKKKRKKNKKTVTSEMKEEESAIKTENMLRITEEENKSVSQKERPNNQDSRPLLYVEHRNLNPDTELKRYFGARAVLGDQRSRQRQRQYYRSTWITTFKNTWPRYSKPGISMRLLETKDGVHYFTFEHNREYQQAQFKFLDAVESMDPNNIVVLLQTNPYHIDSLIQLSDVCRVQEDQEMAKDLIERALYSFECAFHPVFSLTSGVCRLDYLRPENRAFYLPLYKHMMFLERRGCPRTALEFCKLILSLDPSNDPLCMLLIIDFLSLRSREYLFLTRIYEEWEIHRNLSQLPNFAFSVALCYYLLSQQDNLSTDEITQLQAKSDSMLQTALIMFPSVLMPLLDLCSIQPDAAVSSHEFFGNKAQIGQPPALNELVSLYVGRCHFMWKNATVMVWLEKNVKDVLSRVDLGDPVVEDAEIKRKMRYQSAPRSIHRHVVLSEIKEAMAALPVEVTTQAMMGFDPLPPLNSITSYSRPERSSRSSSGERTLSLFFRSLLPNFNLQGGAQQEEGLEVARAGRELNQEVNRLMMAMREMLANIQFQEPPREDNPERDEEEWD